MEIIDVLEIIGTIAFAISGVAVALEEKMDIFGVTIMGITASVGGGVIRDLFLGNVPPTVFQYPKFSLVALFTSLICFIRPFRNYVKPDSFINILFDSIGLGVFTTVGTIEAITMYPNNYLLSIFIGVITGTGGGVLRDIFARRTPAIFIKKFYATAALIGSIFCNILMILSNIFLSMIFSIVIILILRLLAAKYHWKLPN